MLVHVILMLSWNQLKHLPDAGVDSSKNTRSVPTAATGRMKMQTERLTPASPHRLASEVLKDA